MFCGNTATISPAGDVADLMMKTPPPSTSIRMPPSQAPPSCVLNPSPSCLVPPAYTLHRWRPPSFCFNSLFSFFVVDTFSDCPPAILAIDKLCSRPSPSGRPSFAMTLIRVVAGLAIFVITAIALTPSTTFAAATAFLDVEPPPARDDNDDYFIFQLSFNASHHRHNNNPMTDPSTCSSCVQRLIRRPIHSSPSPSPKPLARTFFNASFKLIEPDTMNVSSGIPHAILCHVPPLGDSSQNNTRILSRAQKQTVCLSNLRSCCSSSFPHQYKIADLDVNFSTLSQQHSHYGYDYVVPIGFGLGVNNTTTRYHYVSASSSPSPSPLPPLSSVSGAAVDPADPAAVTTTLHADPFYHHFWDYPTLLQRWQNISHIPHAPVSLYPIGPTFEHRALHMLRIGNNQSATKKILINAGQHAREWITIPVVTYIAERFARLLSSAPTIFDKSDHNHHHHNQDEHQQQQPTNYAELFDDVQLLVVPLVNPDGYVYSSTSHNNRWQRKNRNPFNISGDDISSVNTSPDALPMLSDCDDTDIGVDINRNWGVDFGGQHQSSSDPCSQIYRGHGPFSEFETSVMKTVFEREQPHVHLDFHAYGQLLLGPFSYSDVPPFNVSLVDHVGRLINGSVSSGTHYNFSMGANNDLYAVSGAMTDWTFANGAWAYTVELPPAGAQGLNGFDLSPNHIIPIADDWFHVIYALLAALRADEIASGQVNSTN